MAAVESCKQQYVHKLRSGGGGGGVFVFIISQLLGKALLLQFTIDS